MKPSTLNAQSELNLHIDYDLTLFDTDRFASDLWQEFARLTGLPLEQVISDGAQLHADPILGGYDFSGHAALYGLDPIAMWARLDEIIRSRDYLYEDSAEFMQALRADGYNPRILSFGESHFQRAKIVPYLGKLVGESCRMSDVDSELDYTVIFRKKGEYIAETYPGSLGALVDDVPDQNLPEGFTEIHLDKTLELSSPQEKVGGFVVASLAQARLVIKSI